MSRCVQGSRCEKLPASLHMDDAMCAWHATCEHAMHAPGHRSSCALRAMDKCRGPVWLRWLGLWQRDAHAVEACEDEFVQVKGVIRTCPAHAGLLGGCEGVPWRPRQCAWPHACQFLASASLGARQRGCIGSCLCVEMHQTAQVATLRRSTRALEVCFKPALVHALAVQACVNDARRACAQHADQFCAAALPMRMCADLPQTSTKTGASAHSGGTSSSTPSSQPGTSAATQRATAASYSAAHGRTVGTGGEGGRPQQPNASGG